MGDDAAPGASSPRTPPRVPPPTPDQTFALLREVTGQTVHGSTHRELHATLKSGEILIRWAHECLAPQLPRQQYRLAVSRAQLIRRSFQQTCPHTTLAPAPTAMRTRSFLVAARCVAQARTRTASSRSRTRRAFCRPRRAQACRRTTVLPPRSCTQAVGWIACTPAFLRSAASLSRVAAQPNQQRCLQSFRPPGCAVRRRRNTVAF